MEEGIDSCRMCVKRKIYDREMECKDFLFWRCLQVLKQVRGANECERHAGSEVVPAMRDHAR
jgi:hypothetical protein